MALLSTVVYGNVTVADLLIFSAIVAVSVIIAEVVGVSIKKGLADKVKTDELVKIVRIAQAAIILTGSLSAFPVSTLTWGNSS